MKSLRIFLLLCAVVFGTVAQTTATAQNAQPTADKPRVSVYLRNAVNSAKSPRGEVADSVATLLLRERLATIFGVDSAAQQGDAVISADREPSALLVVAYAVVYRDAAGRILPTVSSTPRTLPVPLPLGAVFPANPGMPTIVNINGLQGDLNPTIPDANGNPITVSTTSTVPATVNLQPGTRSRAITFRARWSDQSWEPRDPGLQGRRTVTILLLPDAVGTDYNLGVTIATITLDDPARQAPVLLNAIQDRLVDAGRNELTELETPGFRSDGRPNSVFYDNNYNILTYSAISSDPNLVSVEVLQSDPRFNGRPSLAYSVRRGAPVGSSATIVVTANDGFGGTATDDFIVRVQQSATSVTVAPSEIGMNIFPNPASQTCTIEAQARHSGMVRIRVSNALGSTLHTVEQPVRTGDTYRQMLDMSLFASGTYFVEITDGSVRTVQQIVKY
jgi:hypothetical protein